MTLDANAAISYGIYEALNNMELIWFISVATGNKTEHSTKRGTVAKHQ